MKFIAVICIPVFLTACSNSQYPDFTESPPSPQQIETGKNVFSDNCEVCHGTRARGLVRNWRQRDENGNLPPPPLNGTAHTWHHDQETLIKTINQGGKPFGGVMPGFKNELNDEQKIAVLAYVLSLWPEEIYEEWRRQNQRG